MELGVSLTPEFLAAVAGVVLSLAFSYVPGLRDWYEALAGEFKRLIMAGVLLLVAIALYALGCAGIVSGVSCDQGGIIRLVWVFVTALVTNQSTYMLAGSQRRQVVYLDEEELPEM